MSYICDRRMSDVETGENRLREFRLLRGFTQEELARRVKDNYIDNNNKLIDLLVDKNTKSIRNKIKKMKLKND
jgi:transcriptional regulator with XRE-family HTH domain